MVDEKTSKRSLTFNFWIKMSFFVNIHFIIQLIPKKLTIYENCSFCISTVSPRYLRGLCCFVRNSNPQIPFKVNDMLKLTREKIIKIGLLLSADSQSHAPQKMLLRRKPHIYSSLTSF